MFNQKKGQFLVLSAAFLVLLLVFTYSLETENFYIQNSAEKHIINNIIYETCQIGYLSNGTQLNGSLNNWSLDINSYCNGLGKTCGLLITNNSQIPPSGNWSLLNYSHYNYTLNFQGNSINSINTFSC